MRELACVLISNLTKKHLKCATIKCEKRSWADTYNFQDLVYVVLTFRFLLVHLKIYGPEILTMLVVCLNEMDSLCVSSFIARKIFVVTFFKIGGFFFIQPHLITVRS